MQYFEYIYSSINFKQTKKKMKDRENQKKNSKRIIESQAKSESINEGQLQKLTIEESGEHKWSLYQIFYVNNSTFSRSREELQKYRLKVSDQKVFE